MVFVDVLKRKDASSVIVAIVLGYALFTFVSATTYDLAAYVAGGNAYGFDNGFNVVFLQPIVALLFQVGMLELVLRVVLVVKDRTSRQANSRTLSK